MDFDYDSLNNDIEVEFLNSNKKSFPNSELKKFLLNKQNKNNIQIFSPDSKDSNLNFMNFHNSSNEKHNEKYDKFSNNISKLAYLNISNDFKKLIEETNKQSNLIFFNKNVISENSKKNFLDKLNSLANQQINKKDNEICNSDLSKNNIYINKINFSANIIKYNGDKNLSLTFGKFEENNKDSNQTKNEDKINHKNIGVSCFEQNSDNVDNSNLTKSEKINESNRILQDNNNQIKNLKVIKKNEIDTKFENSEKGIESKDLNIYENINSVNFINYDNKIKDIFDPNNYITFSSGKKKFESKNNQELSNLNGKIIINNYLGQEPFSQVKKNEFENYISKTDLKKEVVFKYPNNILLEKEGKKKLVITNQQIFNSTRKIKKNKQFSI